ncbi:hypothetical protein [Spirulina sp. 06S082]|uniref:hypothetical protein n=1 Tax=Spirulina sp. 06S082 TaxID=3110248 RepID=UPI002B20A1BD|nr:hypothetical protein [Spirulina sp. 06S082]MEA5471664.1 hypothetical protein [Spirulina sp. 06S082]
MESSNTPVETASEPPPQGWAGVLGMAIAILTLVIPTFAIAYYSSPSPQDALLLPTPEKTTEKTTDLSPEQVYPRVYPSQRLAMKRSKLYSSPQK